MSTENTRPLLLFLAIMTTLSLAPMLSHAAVFWDDEMEEGNTEFSPNYMLSTMIPGGNMAYDTNVKFSGAGSLRYNYPSTCQNAAAPGVQVCGGWIDRTFPETNEHFGRVYIRLPPDFKWGAVNGQTKIFGVRSTNGLSKLWFNFYFSLGMIVSAENTPNTGQTSNIPINTSMPREQWVCFEWHFINNNPAGTPNGTLQTWNNGVQTVLRNDIQWRGTGNTSVGWGLIRMYRQSGFGNIWFDRMAVGSTRIGCLKATSASDTTRPAPPQGLVIR